MENPLSLHRRPGRPHRRRRLFGFLFWHHFWRHRGGQNWLRKTRDGRIRTPCAVRHSHAVSCSECQPGDRLQSALLRLLHFRAGKWHPRSGRESADCDRLPKKPHPLPEHPSRKLACWNDSRRARHTFSGRRSPMEGKARAVSHPHRDLRIPVLRAEVPKIRSFLQGAFPWPDDEGRRNHGCQHRWHSALPVLP